MRYICSAVSLMSIQEPVGLCPPRLRQGSDAARQNSVATPWLEPAVAGVDRERVRLAMVEENI
jgi:hypothetical protein